MPTDEEETPCDDAFVMMKNQQYPNDSSPGVLPVAATAEKGSPNLITTTFQLTRQRGRPRRRPPPPVGGTPGPDGAPPLATTECSPQEPPSSSGSSSETSQSPSLRGTTTIAKRPRHSLCGAPIPSFGGDVVGVGEGILDVLERELREDDEEVQKRVRRRIEREQVRQEREAWRNDRQSKTAEASKEIVELLSSDGEEGDDVLNFDFRGKTDGKATTSAMSQQVLGKTDSLATERQVGYCEADASHANNNNNDAIMDDDTHGEMVGDSSKPSRPLLESTNCDTSPDLGAIRHPPLGSSVAPKPVSALLLLQAAQEIFAISDPRTCTVKLVCTDLERRFGVQLDKDQRTMVRGRLMELIVQQQKQNGFPTITAANNGVKDIDTVPNHLPLLHNPTLPTLMQTEPLHLPKAAVPAGTAHLGANPGTAPTRSPKFEALPSSSSLRERDAPIPKRWGRKPRVLAGQDAPPSKPAVPTIPPPTKRRGAAAANDPTVVAPRAPRRRKVSCALCTTCPCHAADGTTATTTALTTLHLAHSDAAVEKALLRRLHKLEQSADRYDEQAATVRRKLKTHRRDMWRKWEKRRREASTSARPNARSRFLPDVEEMDRHGQAHLGSARMGASAVEKARSTVFSFAPTYQPTLTQMFGCGSTKQNGDEEESPMDQIVEETESQLVEAEGRHCESDGDDNPNAADDNSGLGVGCEAPHEPLTPVIEVHRVEIRNGVDTTDAPSRLWGAYLAGAGPKSQWDRIFEDPKQVQDLDLRQLESLFEAVQTQEPTFCEQSVVQSSMLTQRGRTLADEIATRAASDSAKLARLEAACPSWQENVRFAMHQQTPEVIRDALESVREAQSKLLRVKEAALLAINAQEDALQIFEESLTKSLARLESQTGDDAIGECEGTSSSPKLATVDAVPSPDSPASLDLVHRSGGIDTGLHSLSARSQATLVGSPSGMSLRSIASPVDFVA